MDSHLSGPLTNGFVGSRISEPVAVIGIGCRLPGGADSPETYWRLLDDGIDAITETPPDRWNVESFYVPDVTRPGKTQSRWGGYVDRIDQFDPQLFGISPKEASAMDPQQRMLMEVAWRALEDAGQPIGQIAGRDVSVFVGISSFDYAVAGLSFQDRGVIGSYNNTGGSSSIAANRISYCFDLRGPSVAIDTACSSSLVAVHLACESLRRGESEMALCGGVNALLLPDFYVAFSQLGVLSPDGRCKTFDARANGYVRSEGAGMVLLKPLRNAIRDNDSIYCVIRGTAVNQDGHTLGLTVPSGQAQQALVRTACRNAGIDPSHIQYVETHGTGTPVGDPIEAKALGEVLCSTRPADNPCLVGSVKTNIGHLEAGAGIASLIKVALSVHHGKIPAHLHLQTPNPEIDFDQLRLRVPTATESWPQGETRLAGINGFGYGGANAHVIVEGAPPSPTLSVTGQDPVDACGKTTAGEDGRTTAGRSSMVLPISARSLDALCESAERMADWLSAQSPHGSMIDIAATAAHRHSHFEYRGAVAGQSLDDWASQLRAIGPARGDAKVSTSDRREMSRGANLSTGLLFVCCGQGTQWWAMGRGMYQTNPIYREVIDRCDREYSKHVDWSLCDQLERDEARSRMHETSIAQPALFAVQVALAACWAEVGVRPSAIIGHSVGEIAAAHLSGALSFEDGCLVAIERGRTMDAAASRGAMIAAGLSAEEALHRIKTYEAGVSLAAINGPSSVTISGASDAVERLAKHLDGEGIFCKRLAVEYAFHSAQMDPIESEILRSLATIGPRETDIQFISTVTGQPISGRSIDAAYWWKNVRQSVRFADAMMEAAKQGFELAIELGPHPALTYAIDECCRQAGGRINVVPSLRRDQQDDCRFAQSVAQAYNLGVEIDWNGLYGEPTRWLRLPPYPFQNQSLWVESQESRSTRLASSHPLLGQPTDHTTPAWQSRLDLTLQASLQDHRVRGNCMLPAAAMIETALAAGRQARHTQTVTLGRIRFDRPCILTDDRPLTMETSYRSDRRQLNLSVREIGDTAWNHLASADLLSDASPTERLAASTGEVRSRCTEAFDSDRCYDFCERLGLQYGAGFRGIVRGWRRDGEVIAEVHLESLDDHLGYREGIHPAILDSCFHGMVVADPNFDHTVDGLFLPREIARIEFIKPAPTHVQVHVRVTIKTHQRMVADLDILDSDGNPCICVRGFVSQRAGRADEQQESIRDWLYRYCWTPSQIEDEGIVTIDKTSSDVWCVLADQGPMSNVLIEKLRSRPGRVIRVDHGDKFKQVSADQFVLNPERKQDFDQFLAMALADARDADVHWVYLWGLDVPNVDQLDIDAVQQSTILTTLAPMHLVQAWNTHSETRSARLTVITRGAQSADDLIEPVSVAQMPLIGFARVIVSEMGSFRTKLIDLPAQGCGDAAGGTDAACPSMLDRLIGELTSRADAEDELMYRGGQRYAHRFVPHFSQPIPCDSSASMQSGLEIGEALGIDDLRYRSKSPARLGPAEVEIEVAASGLNFSDVMKALQLYPGIEGEIVHLGAECSGRITRLGSDVTDLRVGQEVMAVARGSFATHVVVDSALVAPKPTNLTHQQAATIPIAFLTASHALQDCARIRQGESVLIHAASGGVGLAAMQLARLVGATVYATAGSDEKRDFVRQQGAALVMDSRSLQFADQVIAATSGDGVDVILNSLPGEAIARGLASLKIGGRFLEIGKRDIYDDGSLGMYPLRNNLALFAIDLDQLFTTQAEPMGAKLRELARQFEQGTLQPLPVAAWECDETDTAFRFMQQAKHIGKVAIEYPQPPRTVYAGKHDSIQFRRDGTYWIVGGLGGFGLQIARWLGRRGAGCIVLSGRSSKVNSEALEVIGQLESAGVSVHVIPADATDPSAVDDVLRQIDTGLPPLRGVIHAAMVLEDRLLADLDRSTLQRVLYPKVLGGWNLHRATVDRSLDHFILFSSLSSVFGHAGQANYSAANALLDGLAHYRRSQGLPACVINWGHLGEVGYLARREELGERLKRQGVLSFDVAQATECLDHALASGALQLSVLRMDWSLWRGLGISGEVSPRFSHLLDRRSVDDNQTASADQIRQADPIGRRELVDNILRLKIASLLGFNEGQLDARRSLVELGLDSLMAVELRNWIESQIQISLPISQLMRNASLGDLVGTVCEIVSESLASSQAPAAQESVATNDATIDPDEAKDLLDTLPQLPQEEVASLLAQMLREQGSTTDDPS